MKTKIDHAANLKAFEINMLIDRMTYYWTPADRQAFAAEYPALYNRIVGQDVFKVVNAVRADGWLPDTDGGK